MLVMHDGIFNVPHVDFITFAKNVQGQLLGVTETLNDGIDETRVKGRIEPFDAVF